MGLLAALRVRLRCSPPTFPTDSYPSVEFVKVNGAGEHQQPGGDDILTALAYAGEPATGDDSGALGADVVAALRGLAEMINQRLQFGAFGGE
jgi:hypothetical protein